MTNKDKMSDEAWKEMRDFLAGPPRKMRQGLLLVWLRGVCNAHDRIKAENAKLNALLKENALFNLLMDKEARIATLEAEVERKDMILVAVRHCARCSECAIPCGASKPDQPKPSEDECHRCCGKGKIASYESNDILEDCPDCNGTGKKVKK